jgi:ABC-type nitrate/sulfonate/bicarbonate transport system permease component
MNGERGSLGRLGVVGAQAALALALLGLWYLATRARLVSPLLLPRPEDVARKLPMLLGDGATWAHVRLTVMEFLSAFGLSLLAGLGLGFWAGRSPYATRLLEPLLVALYTVPIVLLYPICILVFGIGPASKVAFAAVYGFFPIAFNTMRGLASVNPKYLTAAISLGATELQLVRHVLLPGALPVVVSGIRIGAAFDLIGVIAGEMLGATGGLGYQIVWASQTFNVPDLYAYMLMTLVLAGLVNAVVSRTEERGF